MVDRASTFARPGIVELLQTRFVPVALDQAYQRRQQDAEGEFYRKIAGQGPRNDFEGTTQGFYIAAADGRLLLFNNNRDPAKLERLMRRALEDFSPPADVEEIKAEKLDPRFNVEPPEGGLVVRVHTKVMGGYEPTDNAHEAIFQSALGRDNLWITKNEHEALARGNVPESLARRIARYHLVDNTRGEPPMWREDEIRQIEMKIEEGRLTGRVHLETADGDRGYEAELLGDVETKDGRVVRFDVVAKGDFWGEGRFTRRAPEGRFPLAVSFALADGNETADAIPPQGSRGWVAGYLR